MKDPDWAEKLEAIIAPARARWQEDADQRARDAGYTVIIMTEIDPNMGLPKRRYVPALELREQWRRERWRRQRAAAKKRARLENAMRRSSPDAQHHNRSLDRARRRHHVRR